MAQTTVQQTAYALLCRRDLPEGARHTQLFSDPARRHHLVTVAHQCAEAEIAPDALGRPLRVTWSPAARCRIPCAPGAVR